MAKVGYVDPNIADITNFYKILRAGNRFSSSRMVKKRVFLSPAEIESIKGRSLMKTCSALWATLSAPQKAAWKAVDWHTRKNGFSTFFKDQSARIKSDISGIATPVATHQAWVGLIQMDEGAKEYKIKQSHPTTYYLKRKIPGTKSQYHQVEVKENFYLPLTLGISYKANMIDIDYYPVCQFYAIITSHYQGRDIETFFGFDLELSNSWQTVSKTILSVLGEARFFDLYFYVKNFQGSLYFDNLKAIHNGVNWVRDFQCDEIEANFTGTWNQIAKNWELITDDAHGYHLSGYPEI
jgi:hypothetical protein